MNFLKKIFNKNDGRTATYDDFWIWFRKNEKMFFKAVKKGDNVERDFFDKLAPKLSELREGFFFLTGMQDDRTAELIITADGVIKNIVYAEELVAAAPEIPGWKFTALKPALDIENVNIRMGEYVFCAENLWFYANEYDDSPQSYSFATSMQREQRLCRP